MARFTFGNKTFYIDGKPFNVRSGAMHYFRIPEYYWQDRLLKLKECGFNVVETYIAWNFHEQTEGVFDFSGQKDFGKFLDIASSLGLKAIVRPGPYICAEWEMGGFPPYLLKDKNLKLRCDNEPYLEKCANYLRAIAPIIRPRLIENGGNIIMLQVENEYASFGYDSVYLNKLKNMYDDLQLNACLITADGAAITSIERAKIDGCIPTFTFGSKTQEKMEMLQAHIGELPAMCTEFWDGWFDHWYDEEHHVRSVESILADFEPFLKNGYHFNFYMFHGGTNFGFMNGANFSVPDGARFCDGVYKPTVTSYDYNALLSEAGDRTEAYYAVRNLIEKYTGEKFPLTASESVKKGYGAIEFTHSADLFDNLDNIGQYYYSTTPLSMEDCNQNYGYVMYSSELMPNLKTEFRIMDLKDRANVFIDRSPFGVFERSRPHETVYANTDSDKHQLHLLVENMGRINYGSYVEDRKGISGVKFWEVQLFHWKMTTLPMDNLDKLCFSQGARPSKLPTFYKGVLRVDKAEDTFIKPHGFSKGFIVVNGFNVGRFYNQAGPQKTLYVPKCYLKDGDNEIIVFDSDGAKEISAISVHTPEL